MALLVLLVSLYQWIYLTLADLFSLVGEALCRN